MSKSPVETFYDELWRILETDEEFCTFFKEGNRKKYVDREALGKESYLTSDYPAIAIFPSSDRLPERLSTDVFAWQHLFSIEILSGKRDLSVFLRGQWLVCKLILSRLDELKSLQWEGRDVVICIDVDSSASGLNSSLGILQWGVALRVKVRLGIDANALKNKEL